MRARVVVESCVMVTLLVVQTACQFGHSDPCPYNPSAQLDRVREGPFTWELPDDHDPVFTVHTARLPGPTRLLELGLLSVDGGWVFDYADGVPAVNFGTPPEPCSGEFEWEMVFGLPGREDSAPVRLPAAIDYVEPEVVCPWEDDENCIEVAIFL